MTRTYTRNPVWTWVCDECDREEFLARSQSELPTMEEMQVRGWFIAETFGDLCPQCIAERGEEE